MLNAEPLLFFFFWQNVRVCLSALFYDKPNVSLLFFLTPPFSFCGKQCVVTCICSLIDSIDAPWSPFAFRNAGQFSESKKTNGSQPLTLAKLQNKKEREKVFFLCFLQTQLNCVLTLELIHAEPLVLQAFVGALLRCVHLSAALHVEQMLKALKDVVDLDWLWRNAADVKKFHFILIRFRHAKLTALSFSRFSINVWTALPSSPFFFPLCFTTDIQFKALQGTPVLTSRSVSLRNDIHSKLPPLKQASCVHSAWQTHRYASTQRERCWTSDRPPKKCA